jgi:hypothetical protein
MRIEIGKESTPEEILEVIRNNMEGRFFVEDNKLYFDSDKTPILPPRDIRQIPQNYRQPSPTVNSNPFSRMGEQLNKMCGL